MYTEVQLHKLIATGNEKKTPSILFYTKNNGTCENEFGFNSGNTPR
jgi:hypothetical protein